MRASRIPIALSAFALGILVALGATWLLHVGEPDAALAYGDEVAPPLSIGDDAPPITMTDSVASANSSPVSPSRSARESMNSSVTPASHRESGNSATAIRTDLSDMIARLYEESPGDFLPLLVEQLIEANDPMRALALIQEDPGAEGYLYAQVGGALKENGLLAAAIQAYSEGTRLDPMNSDSFGPLLELDPTAALTIVREGLAWQPPPGNSEMRTRLAEALLAADQEEEATKLVDELRAAGVKDTSLSALFAKLSPEAAETEMRGAVEAAVGKKKIRPMQRLASMLERAGQTEEALAVVDSLLELNANNTTARRMLARLDPEAAISFLEERTASMPKSAGLWSEYGDILEAQDRRVDAIAAWEQAVSLNGNYATVRKLLEHAPEAGWSSLQRFTENSSDDERWGDFGDLLWEHERPGEAKRAWEKAWELDPSDGEWYGKLQAMQVGRNPID